MTNKNKIISSAQRFISKGQWDKAIKELQKLVAEDPSDVRALLKLGDVHSKKGDRDAATKVYRQVAESYSDQGFFLKAVAVYKQILKHDPKHLDVTMKLAELYEHLGLSSEAMGQYHRAAQLKEEKGQTRDTLDILRRMVDLDGENVASRIKLAESFSKENLTDQATAEFEKAAQLLKNQNRIDDYIKVAERLIFHDQTRFDLIKELARLYLDRSDAKRALAKLQICFKAQPKDLETLQMLAQAFSALGQQQKTIFVYKELARLHQEQGKNQEANNILQQILLLDPNDPDVKSMIGGAPRSPPPPPSPPARSVSSTGPPVYPPVGNEWQVPSQPGYPFGSQPPSIPMPAIEARPRLPSLDARPAQEARPPSIAPRPAPKDEFVFEDPVEAAPPPPPRPPSLIPRTASGTQRPRQSPEHAEIGKVLTETEVYIKYGLRDKALSHLRRVFELDPDNIEGHQKMRDIYRAMGDRARAAEAVANVMHVHQKRGDLASLEAARSELAQLLPGHPLASGGIPGAIPKPMSRDEGSGEHISIDIDEDSGVFELTDEVREPQHDEPIGDRGLRDRSVGFGDEPFDTMLADDEALSMEDERPAFARSPDVIADDLLADGHLEFRPDAMTDPAPEEPPRLPPPIVRRPPISDLGGPVSVTDDDVPEVFSGVVLLADVETPGVSADANPSFAEDDDEPDDGDVDPFAGNENSEVTARQSLTRAAAPRLDSGNGGRRDSIRREITERAHVDLEGFVDETTGKELIESHGKVDEEATDAYEATEIPDDELEEIQFLLETGLEEEAKESLLALLERAPNHPRVLGLLHSIAAAQPSLGDDAEDTASDQAVATDALPLDHLPLPEDDRTSPEDRYDQGMMYKEIGRIEDAIREFRAAALSESRGTESLEMIGHCLMEKGQPKSAVAYFVRALSTGAEGISAINLEYEIGNACEASDDREGALRWFGTCHEHDPEHRDVSTRLEAVKPSSGNGKAGHKNGTTDTDPPPSPKPSKKSKISYL